KIKYLGDCLDLVRDRLGTFVLLRVCIVGKNFFVGVLLDDRSYFPSFFEFFRVAPLDGFFINKPFLKN
ncbi:MAG: hypothetical protein PHZ25_02960, partial [Candidatus Pacebacteria bacterium]|nr:hypothetical protein [Candidatus Paceibacterota bacterium]